MSMRKNTQTLTGGIMKKLIMVVMLLVVSGCAGLKTVPSSELESEKVFQVPNMKKDEIFEKSKMWIAKNFKSAKAVIEYENKETGAIIGNGIVSGTTNGGLAPISAEFTMEVDIKDEKVRIKITNVHMTINSPFYEMYRSELMPKISDLTSRLESYLLSSGNKSDW